MTLKIGRIYEIILNNSKDTSIGRYLGTHEDHVDKATTYYFFEVTNNDPSFGITYNNMVINNKHYERHIGMIKAYYPDYSNKNGKFFSRQKHEVIVNGSRKKILTIGLTYLYV